MKKLAFIFDTVMLHDEKENYYAINLNYSLWNDRYLPVFENMIVSTRAKNMPYEEIIKKKGYVLSNGKNVTMKPISEYNKITDIFFKRNKIIKQLEGTIDQADCVIVRLPSPLGNLACDICRKKNKKYAIEMVACAWDGYRHHGHWAGKIVAPYMFLQTKKQCKKANRVLYVTSQFLQKRYPTKGISTNASNVMINESSNDVLVNRINKIKTKNGDYVLGLVGPLELESKGHIVALKAIKILKEKYPNIKIEFLGAGDGNKLKKQVNKLGLNTNVVFKGTLPGGDAVLNWMDTIDILVIPSFQEGLPRVLIEAMSRACPAVGARTGGIPELINSEVIHKAGNYKKLATDIEKIIENMDFSIKLAEENFKNSKQYAKENLDSRRMKFWIDFRDNER
jgi:glycosyltransferase involved in cell wall biosynthesis